MIRHATFPTQFETKSDLKAGCFKGYASVFNILDEQGDRVLKGAFHESLDQWQRKGKLPLMLWQHQPENPIGFWTVMREDHKGLYVEGSLILELQKAREAYALMKTGVLDSLSIGYRVQESQKNQRGKERHLTKLELLEVSLVTFAANNDARITAVKDQTFINFDAELLSTLQRAIRALQI